MKSCKYELNFEDENFSFEDEQALDNFLLSNMDRIKRKLNG